MHEKESEEAESLLKMLAPVKNIAESIDSMDNYQYTLNEKMVTIYENCKKLFNFSVGKIFDVSRC